MIETKIFHDVSLLVTHYNRSASLERLLESFDELKCSFHNIIVSDDCSDQEHLNYLNHLQKRFKFEIVYAETNKGLGNNLNKGQDAVTTPFTLYVQEDFVPATIFPEKLEISLNFMKEDLELDMVRYYAYFKYPYLERFKEGFSKMKFSIFTSGYRKFYYYSDHPHLRRTNFFKRFGRYVENVKSDKTEYLMMISVLKNKGKSLFYDDFKGLFEQINSSVEPSTVSRNKLRESPNIFITAIRDLYRHIKFNYDTIK